jgi:hypothetical protein
VNFIECHVGFISADQVGGGVDYLPVEGKNRVLLLEKILRNFLHIRIQTHADQRVILSGDVY